MARFVLADGSVNRNGFRLLIGGLQLEPFLKNPVMLFAHEGRNMPIGKWDNITVEGDKVLADAVFDTNDGFANAIAAKVEGGFLKGASSSIVPIGDKPWSDDQALKLPNQSLPTLVRWTIEEASICGIPANSNCLKLSTAEGTMTVREDDASDAIKLSAYLKKQTKQEPMNKVAASLGLAVDATEDQIVEAINAAKQPAKAVTNLMLAAAQANGLVAKGGEDVFLKLAASNPSEAAEFVLTKMGEAKQEAEHKQEQQSASVKEQLLKLAKGQEQEQQQKEDRSSWSYKDWFDKDPEGLLKLASANKAAFDAIPHK